jgi:hypothetical protein
LSFLWDERICQSFVVELAVARPVWSILQCAFDLRVVPDNINDLYGYWLSNVGKEKKKLAMVGISAVFWTIWNFRNEACFENKIVWDPIVLIYVVSVGICTRIDHITLDEHTRS